MDWRLELGNWGHFDQQALGAHAAEVDFGGLTGALARGGNYLALAKVGVLNHVANLKLQALVVAHR